jgi:hypothetical protein
MRNFQWIKFIHQTDLILNKMMKQDVYLKLYFLIKSDNTMETNSLVNENKSLTYNSHLPLAIIRVFLKKQLREVKEKNLKNKIDLKLIIQENKLIF